jgi:hypothetical protein
VGLAGEDPFEAFGALLDFDPVPRKTNRTDGWDSGTQRAFIAILSLLGSEGRSARAVRSREERGVVSVWSARPPKRLLGFPKQAGPEPPQCPTEGGALGMKKSFPPKAGVSKAFLQHCKVGSHVPDLLILCFC